MFLVLRGNGWIFVGMKEMREEIERIIDDEAVTEDLMLAIIRAIEEDDEPLCDKGRQLLLAALENQAVTDEVLIALTGWSLKSLLNQIGH